MGAIFSTVCWLLIYAILFIVFVVAVVIALLTLVDTWKGIGANLRKVRSKEVDR